MQRPPTWMLAPTSACECHCSYVVLPLAPTQEAGRAWSRGLLGVHSSGSTTHRSTASNCIFQIHPFASLHHHIVSRCCDVLDKAQAHALLDAGCSAQPTPHAASSIPDHIDVSLRECAGDTTVSPQWQPLTAVSSVLPKLCARSNIFLATTGTSTMARRPPQASKSKPIPIRRGRGAHGARKEEEGDEDGGHIGGRYAGVHGRTRLPARHRTRRQEAGGAMGVDFMSQSLPPRAPIVHSLPSPGFVTPMPSLTLPPPSPDATSYLVRVRLCGVGLADLALAHGVGLRQERMRDSRRGVALSAPAVTYMALADPRCVFRLACTRLLYVSRHWRHG